MKSSVLLLDVSNLSYRMGHAHKDRESPYGIPTGAVFGVVKEIVRLCIKHSPAYVVACFDAGHDYRTKIFPGYKDRDKLDDDFHSDIIEQIKDLRGLFEILPFRSVTIGGEEADDLIAHYAKVKFLKDYRKIIVSGDKDLLQLLRKNVSMEMPRGFITRKNFEDFFPVKQERFLDWKILVGDKSDTIPGIKGIGEKYGAEIVEKYETLEAARNADGEGLSTRARNLLVRIDEDWETVERNRLLMDLYARKIKVPSQCIVVGKWQKNAFVKYCRVRGLKSLIRRLPQFSRVMERLEEN